LGAPYGIYQTANGYIAIAMMDIQILAKVIACDELSAYSQEHSFLYRDKIKDILSRHLKNKNSDYWLDLILREDLWAMEVLDWQMMIDTAAYKVLDMEQELVGEDGKRIITTRCPIRINEQKIVSSKMAPALGEHNDLIKKDFLN